MPVYVTADGKWSPGWGWTALAIGSSRASSTTGLPALFTPQQFVHYFSLPKGFPARQEIP